MYTLKLVNFVLATYSHNCPCFLDKHLTGPLYHLSLTENKILLYHSIFLYTQNLFIYIIYNSNDKGKYLLQKVIIWGVTPHYKRASTHSLLGLSPPRNLYFLWGVLLQHPIKTPFSSFLILFILSFLSLLYSFFPSLLCRLEFASKGLYILVLSSL